MALDEVTPDGDAGRPFFILRSLSGNSLTVGATYKIQWELEPADARVRIELVHPSMGPNIPIVESSTGGYDEAADMTPQGAEGFVWTVPDHIVPRTGYKLLVTSLDDETQDDDSLPFEIVAGTGTGRRLQAVQEQLEDECSNGRLLFAFVFLLLAAFCALMAFQVNKAKNEAQMKSMGDIEMDAAPQPAPQPALRAPEPAPAQAPPRQAPPQQAEKPPAPMLKHYFDDGGFGRALQRMRGGLRALTLEEVQDFTVTDNTHGTFTIGSPMATFNVDKQNDLRQLSQLGTGGRCDIAVEDIQRSGMSATAVHVSVSRGRNTRAASPVRSGSIRQYAQNIDHHGSRALTGESYHDQKRAATPPRR